MGRLIYLLIANLFQLNYLPIVNENDTIATSEIKYGDNDRLASRVAQITGADTLILLSDVDGLYTKNPKIFKNAKLIKKVLDINKEIKNISIKGMTEFGSGGMDTKIEAPVMMFELSSFYPDALYLIEAFFDDFAEEPGDILDIIEYNIFERGHWNLTISVMADITKK